jgi:hypothetical protein
VFEKLRLLAECVGISFAACGEAAAAAIGRISSSFLSLLVVKRIREIHPETTVVSQRPPYFIENIQEMSNEGIRVRLVPQFALPSVGP